MATNFALTPTCTTSTIIASLNYALANMGTGGNVINNYNGNVAVGTLVANTTTGTVTDGNVVVSYLYDYVDIMYANSATGGSGFIANATLANYYGVKNTTANVQDMNPVDYAWTQVAGGFGTTNS